jgi:hypothetical protein
MGQGRAGPGPLGYWAAGLPVQAKVDSSAQRLFLCVAE